MKKTQPNPKVLVAVQLTPVTTADGSTGILMLDQMGIVYTYVGTGWAKLNMNEVENDTPV